MQVTGSSDVGYHSNTRIKARHPSYMSRMGSNKRQTTLFGPKAFQVGTSGNSGVGVGVHIGKVDNDEAVCKTDSMVDKSRRVQFGC